MKSFAPSDPSDPSALSDPFDLPESLMQKTATEHPLRVLRGFAICCGGR